MYKNEKDFKKREEITEKFSKISLEISRIKKLDNENQQTTYKKLIDKIKQILTDNTSKSNEENLSFLSSESFKQTINNFIDKKFEKINLKKKDLEELSLKEVNLENIIDLFIDEIYQYYKSKSSINLGKFLKIFSLNAYVIEIIEELKQKIDTFLLKWNKCLKVVLDDIYSLSDKEIFSLIGKKISAESKSSFKSFLMNTCFIRASEIFSTKLEKKKIPILLLNEFSSFFVLFKEFTSEVLPEKIKEAISQTECNKILEIENIEEILKAELFNLTEEKQKKTDRTEEIIEKVRFIINDLNIINDNEKFKNRIKLSKSREESSENLISTDLQNIVDDNSKKPREELLKEREELLKEIEYNRILVKKIEEKNFTTEHNNFQIKQELETVKNKSIENLKNAEKNEQKYKEKHQLLQQKEEENRIFLLTIKEREFELKKEKKENQKKINEIKIINEEKYKQQKRISFLNNSILFTFVGGAIISFFLIIFNLIKWRRKASNNTNNLKNNHKK